jgi:hypothetical protein
MVLTGTFGFHGVLIAIAENERVIIHDRAPSPNADNPLDGTVIGLNRKERYLKWENR